MSLHLAVALRGAGWHPAAWRTPAAEPGRLRDFAYWAGLALEVERARLDFVTIEDLAGPAPAQRHGGTDEVRGRLGAVLLAARIAPFARRIGLMPTVTTPSTSPYQLAQSLATLDHISEGRAGWGMRLMREAGPGGGARGAEAAGLRRTFEQAAEVLEAVRRLWEGAGAFTGRFVRVSGSPIRPRPPQGRPVVAVSADGPAAYRFAARCADIAWITPRDRAQVRSIVAEVRAAEAAVGRCGQPVRLYADVLVLSDPEAVAELGGDGPRGASVGGGAGPSCDVGLAAPVPAAPGPGTAGPGPGTAGPGPVRPGPGGLRLGPGQGGPAVFAGPSDRLADLLIDWHGAGLDGFRLCPGMMPTDLAAITRGLVPELRRRGALQDEYKSPHLRGRLGLGPSRAGRGDVARSTRRPLSALRYPAK